MSGMALFGNGCPLALVEKCHWPVKWHALRIVRVIAAGRKSYVLHDRQIAEGELVMIDRVGPVRFICGVLK